MATSKKKSRFPAISAAQQYEANQKKAAAATKTAATQNPNWVDAWANGMFGTAQPPAAPATPAPTPTVDPFLTPDDLLNINAFQQGYDDSAATINRSLADLETDTSAQKADQDRSAVKGTNDAQENAAARGIFSSSIKDANVYDIEAQRRINKQLLDDHLTTARLDAKSRLGKLSDRRDDFNKAMLGKQVKTAQDVTPAVPTPAPAPTPVPAAAPPKASSGDLAPVASTARSMVKDGWFYREAEDGSGRMLRIRRAAGGS